MLRLLAIMIALGVCSAGRTETVLELTYPAGKSPKVFTSGWVFGANAKVDGKDVSSQVKWSGTAKFSPATGARVRPTFNGPGANTITLTLVVGGKPFAKSFQVVAVRPDNYAAVGDIAFCPADAHPGAGGPFPVQGPILSGSPTVQVRGSPAARKGDTGAHAACDGSNTFEIVGGDPEVLIDGLPAARFGDATQHCGGAGTIVRDRPAQRVISFEGTMNPRIFAGPVRLGLIPGVERSILKGYQTGTSPEDRSVTFRVVWTGQVDLKSGQVTGDALFTRITGKQTMALDGKMDGRYDAKDGSIRCTVTIKAFGGELKSEMVLYRIGR